MSCENEILAIKEEKPLDLQTDTAPFLELNSNANGGSNFSAIENSNDMELKKGIRNSATKKLIESIVS